MLPCPGMEESSALLRIRRYDSHNWVLERFIPGGEPTSFGKPTRDRWQLAGFASSLERVCQLALAEAIPVGTTGAADVLTALKRSELAILQALSRASVDPDGKLDSPVIQISTAPEARAD